jgi:hypothetical protein
MVEVGYKNGQNLNISNLKKYLINFFFTPILKTKSSRKNKKIKNKKLTAPKNL